MDYVKTELLRQQAIWNALAALGTGAETSEDGGLQRKERSHEGGAAAQDAHRAETGLTGAAGAEEVLFEGAESGEKKRSADEALAEAERSRKLQAQRELTALLRRTEAEDAPSRRSGRSDGGAAEETVLWSPATAGRDGRSALETEDAKAISRRFERDARRYDGGYIFY